MRISIGLLMAMLAFVAQAETPDPMALKAQLQDYYFDAARRGDLDMLNTFYNWTIPESVCEQWFRANGFRDITLLNRNEPHACGLHMLGVKC